MSRGYCIFQVFLSQSFGLGGGGYCPIFYPSEVNMVLMLFFFGVLDIFSEVPFTKETMGMVFLSVLISLRG